MPFCSNCGSEVKDNTKFCPECGNSLNHEVESINSQQNNATGTLCPKCGSLIPEGNVACINCGTVLNQESHKTVIILGYIATIISTLLLPFAGIIVSVIFAIYLGTRDNKSVRKHGIIMILLAVVLIIIIFIISYIAYMNSLEYAMSRYNSYYY